MNRLENARWKTTNYDDTCHNGHQRVKPLRLHFVLKLKGVPSMYLWPLNGQTKIANRKCLRPLKPLRYFIGREKRKKKLFKLSKLLESCTCTETATTIFTLHVFFLLQSRWVCLCRASLRSFDLLSLFQSPSFPFCQCFFTVAFLCVAIALTPGMRIHLARLRATIAHRWCNSHMYKARSGLR